MTAVRLAVVQLQAWSRGCGVRGRFHSHNWDAMASRDERYRVALTLRFRPTTSLRRPAASLSGQGGHPQLDKYLAFVQLREQHGRAVPAMAQKGFASWCAARIQAWVRMLWVQRRFRFRRFAVYQIAALQVQFQWREYQKQQILGAQEERQRRPRAAELRAQSPEDRAALSIQYAWRRFTNTRIFSYYRDLIRFRLTGDPAALLKTINPREASLFDKATGIHVRFRLGGSTFPPVMLYKVFMTRPLCDVGAFAPRDYTQSKPPQADQLHLHSSHLDSPGAVQLGQIRVGASYFGTVVDGLGPEGTANWYRRVENNSWRPITQRTLHDATGVQAPWGLAEVDVGVPFHYSRVRRKEDLVRKRKAHKRKWLMEMYKEGLAKERDERKVRDEDKPSFGGNATGAYDAYHLRPPPKPGPTSDLVSEAKGGGTEDDLLDALGQEDIEADELLQWSSELDYDRYVANWHCLATSGSAGNDVFELRAGADGTNGAAAAVMTANASSAATMGPLTQHQRATSSPSTELDLDWRQLHADSRSSGHVLTRPSFGF